MLTLPPETALLAERLAVAQGVPVNEAVRRALEASARAAGLPPQPHRRQSVAAILAVGSEIAAMPVLDRRSATAIMDDVNAA